MTRGVFLVVLKQGVPPGLSWFLVFHFVAFSERLTEVEAPRPTVGSFEGESVVGVVKLAINQFCKVTFHARRER